MPPPNKRNLPYDNIYDKGKTDYNIQDFVIDKTNYPEEPIIIAVWNETNMRFSCLSIFKLNPTTDVIGHYWNPGAIEEIQIRDFNVDGKNEIIISGWNNHMMTFITDNFEFPEEQEVFFISLFELSQFDSGNIIVQAPPYMNTTFPSAEENWYVMTLQLGSIGSIVFTIDDYYYNNCLDCLEMQLKDNNKILWNFDYSGNLTDINMDNNSGISPFIFKIINGTITLIKFRNDERLEDNKVNLENYVVTK